MLRLGRAGFGRVGFGREGFGREGLGREGFGREGLGREGFGRGEWSQTGLEHIGTVPSSATLHVYASKPLYSACRRVLWVIVMLEDPLILVQNLCCR